MSLRRRLAEIPSTEHDVTSSFFRKKSISLIAISFANVAGTMFTHLQRHVWDKMPTRKRTDRAVLRFARSRSNLLRFDDNTVALKLLFHRITRLIAMTLYPHCAQRRYFVLATVRMTHWAENKIINVPWNSHWSADIVAVGIPTFSQQ